MLYFCEFPTYAAALFFVNTKLSPKELLLDLVWTGHKAHLIFETQTGEFQYTSDLPADTVFFVGHPEFRKVYTGSQWTNPSQTGLAIFETKSWLCLVSTLNQCLTEGLSVTEFRWLRGAPDAHSTILVHSERTRDPSLQKILQLNSGGRWTFIHELTPDLQNFLSY